MLRTLCRVPPVCAQMHMRWRGTLPSAKSSDSCQSSSRKCSWTGRTQSSAARKSPGSVFHALFEQGVALEEMLLKPNMVISGKKCGRQASVEEVATATLCCLRRHVPAAVPGIVFLVWRPKHPLGDRPSERHQPAPGPEALEDQFLLRAGTSGPGAGSLARTGQE